MGGERERGREGGRKCEREYQSVYTIKVHIPFLWHLSLAWGGRGDCTEYHSHRSRSERERERGREGGREGERVRERGRDRGREGET